MDITPEKDLPVQVGTSTASDCEMVKETPLPYRRLVIVKMDSQRDGSLTETLRV